MKTLYEILEVSEGASKEIIEKAYKVLAKKYHPDLQGEKDKQKAEELMKQINEAYNILSNDEKRKKYDRELSEQRQAKKQAQINIQKEQSESISMSSVNKQMTEEYRKQQEKIQQQYQEQYQNAYENYLRSLGYKIKYKWTWSRIKDLLKTLLIIAVIIVILWLFPPTHKIILDFYKSNTILQAMVDVIGKIFEGIWEKICSIFGK